MKKIIALLLALVMVFALVACGNPGGEQTGEPNPNPGTSTPGSEQPAAPEAITLKVWAPQEDQVDDSSWLNVMLKRFEEAHPEYAITWETGVCGEGDAGTLVPTDVTAAADVYMFANDQLGTLLQAGALSQLGGSYLEQVKTDVSQTYVDTVTSTDGNVYGFPVAPNTWYMYYNKDVFTEEDVKSLDTMLTKGVVAFPMTTGWYAGAFFIGNGGTLFGSAGVDAAAGIQFGGANGYAAAQYMVDLMANPNFRNDANGLGNAGLKDGTVGAYFSGDWEYAGLYEVLGDKLGAVQAPTCTIDGKTVQMKAFAGSKAIGVNPNCKYQKAAMQLAAFLASAEGQLLRFELRGITPAVTALGETDAVKASIVAVAQSATLANASVAQPSIPEMGNFWSPMEVLGNAVGAGSVNAGNIQEQVDAFVASLNGSGL